MFQVFGKRPAKTMVVDEVESKILPINERHVAQRVGARERPLSLTEVFVHMLPESSVATPRLEASIGSCGRVS